jgi:hypothetical protein
LVLTLVPIDRHFWEDTFASVDAEPGAGHPVPMKYLLKGIIGRAGLREVCCWAEDLAN